MRFKEFNPNRRNDEGLPAIAGGMVKNMGKGGAQALGKAGVDAALVLFVLAVAILILFCFLRFVFLSVILAFWLIGALHVAAFATILPLRCPLVHLYLRTCLLPLLPQIARTASSSSAIFIYLRLELLFIDCTLRLAGFIFLVRFALRIILLPSLALVFLSVILFFKFGAAKHAAGLLTILPCRLPPEQRYLRTTFLPERAQTCFSIIVSMSSRKYITSVFSVLIELN